MKVISLQSGSNGNCIYVETERLKLLIDAGISGKRAEQRLGEFGRDIRDVDAILISHDHGDHIACAGIYQRKFKLPI
ncbi:MAG: MBL fold metallo-hydrolase, partial [bacterium]|nr:MBL fold metallo-hydrolase [bacterium]